MKPAFAILSITIESLDFITSSGIQGVWKNKKCLKGNKGCFVIQQVADCKSENTDKIYEEQVLNIFV